jgi:hypothetical protein
MVSPFFYDNIWVYNNIPYTGFFVTFYLLFFRDSLTGVTMGGGLAVI